MTYSPEQYQASKERIKAAQKRYYQRTREARLSYQKDFELASVNPKPNLLMVKSNLIMKPNLIK
ncbi:hypothetical protein PHYSODRAFT_535825 [Phytophthora sojae]|uniref:Uncharacterized protein n=1 Tax=Phytophthora sojae (strain P6497) TaxID=1094619 RepID=G5AIE6_PHYSP|nr:hypothetical protein PHYSODRAFT_535825 [Phytophthora sojae]EGZ04748.1 hypothetical protein PHYSODRAFT_535825 [Phytophthora sojae]|eukprot:XP_009539847.1 hypothetical protein PHYSODRAFT_535825 [Phytophthora sojae]